MKKYWKKILIFIVVVGLVAAATVGVKAYIQARAPIPKSINKQAGFLLFIPVGAENVSYDKASVKFDSSAGVVSFYTYVNGVRLAFTEQAAPQSFTDVPELYDALLNKLREYQDLNTGFGTVTLTRPVELNGRQSAVSNSKGTLIFAQPTKDLSDSQWQNIFNNMQLVQ